MRPIGSSSGQGHIYIKDGEISINFPGIGHYRGTAVAGWTNFSITSIQIDK